MATGSVAANTIRDIDRLKDVFELLGKAVFGVLGLCYGVGLIVTTIHLYQYGIFSLSLLRISYVMAGVWAFVPLLLTSAVISVVWRLLLRSLPRRLKSALFVESLLRLLKKGRHRLFLKRLAYGLALPLLFLISLGVAVSFLRGSPEPILLPVVPLIFAIPVSLSMVVLYELQLVTTKPLGVSIMFLFVPMFLAFFVFYLMSFGKFEYGKIPAYFGGGRPTPVKLFLDIDDAMTTQLKASGLEFQQEGTGPRLTYEVDLILATDDEYVVKGVVFAVSIPRSTVKAAFYTNAYIGWGLSTSAQ